MRMKRLICVLLAMAMCLGSVCAFAENRVLLNTDERDGQYISVNSMCALDGTLYMLAYDENGLSLYGWNEGMDDAVRFDGVKGLAEASSLLDAMLQGENELADMMAIQKDAGLDPVHAVSQLFTDGQRLMSLNAATGLVYAMEVKDGAVVYTDVVTLKDVSAFLHKEEDWVYMATCYGAAVAGGKLLWCVNDWTNDGRSVNKLIVGDLTTGEVTESKVAFVTRVCAYTQDKALVVIRDEDNAYQDDGTVLKPELYIYDASTDTAQRVAAFDVPYSLESMVYAADVDAVLYTMNSRVMGISMADGSARQYGFYTGNGASGLPMQVLGSSVVIPSWDRVLVRNYSAEFSSDVYLNVYGSWADSGRILFSQRYPDIPVYDSADYYDSMESINQAMVSGSNALDVLTMNVDYSSFLTMRDKGYCADLSAYTDLVEMVDRMYPCFSDVVKKDGKLVGVPVSAYSWGWYVNNSVMETMGLTMEEIPTNFVELCGFITDFNDNRAEDCDENVTLFDIGGDVKSYLFGEALEMYLGWCAAEGRDVTFNTPEFRAVMTAVENVRTDNLKVSDWENDVYYEPLLMNGYTLVGDFGGYRDYSTFLPLSLTADIPFRTGVSVSVMFINPRSANMEAAVNLLRCKLEALEDNEAYTLFTDKTEPVNNPYYDEWMDWTNQFIEQLKEQIAGAEDEAMRRELQESLDFELEYLEKYEEQNRYTISPSGIAHYRDELAPVMYVRTPNFTTSTQDDATSELNTLISRYMDGQITLDQFIREADNKMMMIRMENN